MKLKIALFTALLGAMLLFGGCGNKQIIDTTYTFNRAIIELPNGEVIEGKVDSWRDYEDGDQIQVVIEGKTYLVHSSRIVLIKD
jgi:hypothetical protein